MTLTVLTDEQIRTLLEALTASELEGFSDALASALHEYATGANDQASAHQPERISVQRKTTGATTLFMPSCSSAGNAVKVITLTSATTELPSSIPDIPVPPIRPTGAITLFTPDGQPSGLLHASTLTAFRTALASLALVRQRTLPAAACLVVFGCGEQAYWHVRLALLARGADIKQVVFVNRRVSESCRHTVKRFAGMGDEVKEREGWAGCEFGVLIKENEGDGYAAVLADVLRDADVVFCCTPATEALFDAGAWEGAEGGAKGRLLVAIGSYTPEMREIPAGLITRALGDGEREAGVVVVDTIEGALTEAGELIDLGVKREQMVEVGELIMGESPTKQKLEKWLQTGNVIYKSVGLGLMDLSVGMYVVEFAKGKEVGTQVEGF